MSYAEFFGTVVGGRKDLGNGKDKVMPAFADNKNVMCYLNDIYVYLRARSTGRGRARATRQSMRPSPPPSPRPRTNAWVPIDD